MVLLQPFKEYLTLGAVVGSMLFAGIQSWRMKKQMEVSVYASISDRVFSVNQIFINKPSLRRYFYGDPQAEHASVTQEDYNEILSVAEYILDFSSSLIEHRDLMKATRFILPGTSRISWGEWEKYIEDIMKSSPIICRLLLEKRKWYEDSLWKLSPILKSDKHEEIQGYLKLPEKNKRAKRKKNKDIEKMEAAHVDKIIQILFPISGQVLASPPELQDISQVLRFHVLGKHFELKEISKPDRDQI